MRSQQLWFLSWQLENFIFITFAIIKIFLFMGQYAVGGDKKFSSKTIVIYREMTPKTFSTIWFFVLTLQN